MFWDLLKIRKLETIKFRWQVKIPIASRRKCQSECNENSSRWTLMITESKSKFQVCPDCCHTHPPPLSVPLLPLLVSSPTHSWPQLRATGRAQPLLSPHPVPRIMKLLSILFDGQNHAIGILPDGIARGKSQLSVSTLSAKLNTVDILWVLWFCDPEPSMSAEPALLFQPIYMAPGQEVQLPSPNIVKHHHFFSTFSQHPMLFSMGCRKRGRSVTQLLPKCSWWTLNPAHDVFLGLNASGSLTQGMKKWRLFFTLLLLYYSFPCSSSCTSVEIFKFDSCSIGQIQLASLPLFFLLWCNHGKWGEVWVTKVRLIAHHRK